MKQARRQRWDLSTDTVVENFNAFVTNMRLAGKRPLVELVPESRSLDQNEMIHAIYKQIAEQKPDETFNEIRCYCKLHHGVGIMRRDDEVFRYVYDRAFKPLDYEFKLKAMEQWPVTSKMSKKQATEYIDEIIREFSKQGYSLINPSEEQAYA